MVRSFPLLYVAAALLAAASTHALEASVSLGFGDTDPKTFAVDEFDSGPSSGPFSNKPGWPKLDGPGEDDGATTTAPPSGPSINNAGLTIAPPKTAVPITTTPMTQSPATKSPSTQAPATKSPMTRAPATKSPTTQVPMTKSPMTQSPATKSPTTQAPATKSPTTQKPATKSPVVTPAPTKGTGATPAGKPATTAPKNTSQSPATGPSHCTKDSVHVSVEGVKGVYCVPSAEPVCSAQHPKGSCPGPQSGLEKGSHCSIVKSGAYGCVPSAGGAKHKGCHE